ncbi:hypothetical protein Tco_1158108, partial [Tanacetum coccineum]
MMNVVLNELVLNSFELGSNFLGISDDPYSRDLQKYSSEFKNKITQLAKKCELRMGKKGYILDDILEKIKQVNRGTVISWYNEGFEEEEQRESNMDGTVNTNKL